MTSRVVLLAILVAVKWCDVAGGIDHDVIMGSGVEDVVAQPCAIDLLALERSVDGIRDDRSTTLVARLYCGMEVRCMTEFSCVVVDEGLKCVLVAFADKSYDRVLEVLVHRLADLCWVNFLPFICETYLLQGVVEKAFECCDEAEPCFLCGVGGPLRPVVLGIQEARVLQLFIFSRRLVCCEDVSYRQVRVSV